MTATASSTARTAKAVRKTLLATPIDGARITSGFGAREHPILGYTKMHKGIDFGAPTGTPIFAAGNGTIVEMGRKGSYGNYVRIKHNGTYQTAYAHTSRFAKGLHKGDKVKQGQVIAYVGTTGRSTGPHLHFEVLLNGAQVNPKTVKSTGSSKLAGKDLKAFKAQVASIDADRQRMRGAVEIAETARRQCARLRRSAGLRRTDRDRVVERKRAARHPIAALFMSLRR